MWLQRQLLEDSQQQHRQHFGSRQRAILARMPPNGYLARSIEDVAVVEEIQVAAQQPGARSAEVAKIADYAKGCAELEEMENSSEAAELSDPLHAVDLAELADALAAFLP